MHHRWFPILSLSVSLAAPASGVEEPVRPELLPRDAEIRAALAAGPPHFAETAGVYVLTANGYELARPSQNGFHCLVGRELPGAFEPMCFDREGSATLLRQILLSAELQMQGKGLDEIEVAVAAAWASGELRAPSRPGINYMLSPENRVPIDEQGTIAPYRPHLMFYVPYLTNADLGSDGSPGSPVFVIFEGQPGAYAIVPVPVEEAVAHDAH